MKRFALGLLGIVLALPLFAQQPPPPAGPPGPPPAEMQKMREMHEKHEQAMQADMDKMKSILEQMKSNLNRVKSNDPAVKKQLQLDVDMWQAFADHMNHMQQMHEQMRAEMKKHMGEGDGHGRWRHHGDQPSGPPPPAEQK